MNNKKFSIVVPIYNVELYLEKCIESIVNQTYLNIEIILVDDGSKDKSAEICDKWALIDKRIIVIHKENNGVVSARNDGVLKATGDYIICVDGDDWIDSCFVSKSYDILMKYDVDMICFGHMIAMPQTIQKKIFSNPVGYYDEEKITKNIYPILIENKKGKSFSASIWSKVFKKDKFLLFSQLIDERITLGEDIAFVRTYTYSCNSLYISSDCPYYYRYNPSSITKSKKPFDWNGLYLRTVYYVSAFKDSSNELKQQVNRYITHSLYNTVLSQFYSSEKYSIIKGRIRKQLDNPIYSDKVKNCKYDFFTMHWLMTFALRHKLIWLIYIHNKVRK